jgi:lysophospholipase L1-like esterase
MLRMASTLSLALLPVLVLQGLRVRQATPRLPEAAGARAGDCPGAEPRLDLLVLGESTAAGVGAADHAEGLAGQLATALAAETGRAVRWRVLGRIGATAHSTRTALLEPATEVRADVAVLALGVNDVLRLRGPRRWVRDLRQLIAAVRERCGAIPVIVAAVPPVGRFPALPHPLRGVLGLRARLLDRATIRLARTLENVHHVPMPALPDAAADAFFCADGFHPSPRAYRLWARTLVTTAARCCETDGGSAGMLQDRPASRPPSATLGAED